jgi:hypothetical protein
MHSEVLETLTYTADDHANHEPVSPPIDDLAEVQQRRQGKERDEDDAKRDRRDIPVLFGRSVGFGCCIYSASEEEVRLKFRRHYGTCRAGQLSRG